MEIDDLILLLAAAQGLFLTILIFHRHRKLFANRFLGTMLLLYSIMLLHLLFGELKYYEIFPQITLTIVGIGFLVAPLHYLYVKHLVQNKPINKTAWFHITPFFIYECFWIPQLLRSKEELIIFFSYTRTGKLPIHFLLYNWAIIVQASVYMGISIHLIRQYTQNIRDVFSTIDKIKLTWLRNITYMAIGFISVFFIENVFMLFQINLSNYFTLTSVLTAVYVYVLGYLGLSKSEIFTMPEIAGQISHLSELSYHSQLEKQETSSELEKYKKSGLSKEKAKKALEKLHNLMHREKPYTNSNLTLNQLAEMLSISPHNLSEIINTQLHQNFFDFVNGYRIERVKKDLTDPKKKHLTLLAIGLDAGFNSKSSFNAIFKKRVHSTPSAYRRQLNSSHKK